MEGPIRGLGHIGHFEVEASVNCIVMFQSQFLQLVSDGFPGAGGAHHQGELPPGVLGQEGEDGVGHLGGRGKGAGKGWIELFV